MGIRLEADSLGKVQRRGLLSSTSTPLITLQWYFCEFTQISRYTELWSAGVCSLCITELMETLRFRWSTLPKARHLEINIASAFPLHLHSGTAFWKHMEKAQSVCHIHCLHLTSAPMTHAFPSPDIQWAKTLSFMPSVNSFWVSTVIRPYRGAGETVVSQAFSAPTGLRWAQASVSILNPAVR